jgi:hypothetical protein
MRLYLVTLRFLTLVAVLSGEWLAVALVLGRRALKSSKIANFMQISAIEGLRS